MKPGNFFAELKRRNVYKVAISYAVITKEERFPTRGTLTLRITVA